MRTIHHPFISRKAITASLERSGHLVIVYAYPQMTAGSLLGRLGLSPALYHVLAPDRASILHPNERLYPLVRPGDELKVVPRAVPGRRRSKPQRNGQVPRAVARLETLDQWLKQNSWSRIGGNSYRGSYSTPLGQWKGEVHYLGCPPSVQIASPPPWLVHGTFSHLIRRCGHGWFQVIPPVTWRGVRSVVRGVEGMILEAAQRQFVLQ